jgi:CheY-like chemotaxis protein
MNGIELATSIRKMNKDIPIILMGTNAVIDIDPLLLKYLNIEDIIKANKSKNSHRKMK